MPKLYGINLYIYIFLLHFVVNEEKLYFRKKDSENNIEFSLNLNSAGGQKFYEELQKNTLELSMTRQTKYFSASINIELGNADTGVVLKKGEIGHSGNMLSIATAAGNKMFLKIGKVTRDEEFDSFLNEIPKYSTFTIEFILVKDEEATEEKENETQEKNESETPEENKNKTIKKKRNRGLGKQWK